MNNTTQTASDPTLVSASKALIQHESGGNFKAKGASGEYGAGQWMPETWNAQAKKHLGYVPKFGTDEMTPEIQKAVIYLQAKEDKEVNKLNVAQFFAKWNSGSPDGWEKKVGVNKYGVKYDVPAYVKSTTDLYQQYKQQYGINNMQSDNTLQGEATTGQNEKTSEFNPLFKSNPNDSLLKTGLKTLGNVIPSAINFGKNVFSTLNPANTFRNIQGIIEETKNLQDVYGNDMAGSGKATLETVRAIPNALAEGLIPTAGRELVKAGYRGITGQDNTQSLQNAQQAITEDPFGQIAPFLLGARQLAEKSGYVSQFDDFVKKGVDATIKPITKPLDFAKNKTGQIINGVVSQTTGLNPETVKALVENPELYTKTARENINRNAIADKVGKALDDLESQISESGQGYNTIRENTGVTYIAPTFLNEALKPFNIKVENGKIITSAESTPLNNADISQLQDFVNKYGKERFLTNNAFLNARTALSDMSKYDAQKTGRLQNVARTLREAYDAVGKEKIEGLNALDEKFSPMKRQFEALRKDYLKKENGEYVFKDGAVTKLANLDKVGRERILGRLEELVPDISKDIKVLKVVEDIERANGFKVGTYARGALLGGGFLTGGVIGGIISAIITSPEIAVPLIRGYGLTKAQTAQLLINLRVMLGEAKGLNLDESTLSRIILAFSGEDKQLNK